MASETNIRHAIPNLGTQQRSTHGNSATRTAYRPLHANAYLSQFLRYGKDAKTAPGTSVAMKRFKAYSPFYNLKNV